MNYVDEGRAPSTATEVEAEFDAVWPATCGPCLEFQRGGRQDQVWSGIPVHVCENVLREWIARRCPCGCARSKGERGAVSDEVRIVVQDDCPRGSIYSYPNGDVICHPRDKGLAERVAADLLAELRSVAGHERG